MRKIIVLSTLLVGLSSYAGTTSVPTDHLELKTPPGQTALEQYLKDFPLRAVYSLDGDKLQIKSVPQFGVFMYFFSRKFVPGAQKVHIEGRSLSGDAQCTFKLWIHGMHWGEDNCNGSTADGKVFEFKVPFRDGAEVALDFPFELANADMSCERCGKVLDDCRISATLRLDPPPTPGDCENYGVVIDKIELITTFDAVSGSREQINSGSWLSDFLRQEQDRYREWKEKHAAIFQNYPRDNALQAEGLRNFSPRNAADSDWLYFTPEELSELNPAFTVRKLAGWPFYHSGVYLDGQNEFFGLKDVNDAFIFHDVIYAEGNSFLSRWNPDAARWDYIMDNTVFRSSHRPVETFPQEAGQALYGGHKAVRLSDGASITPPPEIDSSQGQCAVVKDKFYHIDKDRKGICRRNGDFSDPQPLELRLPEQPGLKYHEIRNICPGGDDSHLLIEYFSEFEYNRISVILEADLTTGACDFKLPFDRKGSSLRSSLAPWYFYGDGMRLCDLGPGLPFAVPRRSEKQSSSSEMNLPQLAVGAEMDEILSSSVRVGSFAAAGNQKTGRILFINLFDPANSLQLNGFEHFRKIRSTPDQAGLWITMPDGLYEVRPQTIPPMPELHATVAVPEAAPEAPESFRPQDVVTDIDVETPAIFDAAQDNGDILFTVKPSPGAPKLVLHLNLPRVENPPKYYLFEFDGAADSLFLCNPENAQGERDVCRWYRRNTLRVKSDSVKLSIETTRPDKEQTIRLKRIVPYR